MGERIVVNVYTGKKGFVPRFTVFFINFGIVFLMLSNISQLVFGKELAAITLLQKITTVACLIVSVAIIIFKNKIIQLLKCSLVWVVLHVIAYIVNPDISILFSRIIIYSFGYLVVLACLFITIEDLTSFIKAYTPYIYISVLLSVLQVLCYTKSGVYSMQYSYYTVPVAIICMCQTKKSTLFYIPLLIIILTDLVCGSRGCFLCFVIAVIFIELLSESSANRVIVVSVLAIAFALLIINLPSVAKLALRVLPDSRTLLYLAEGNLNLSGRDVYYGQLFGEIVESGFSIHGLYSDRLFMANYFSRTTMAEIYGSYSHNIIIEVLFQFGWLGIPVLVIMLLGLCKSFLAVKRSKEEAQQTIWICFASFALGQLLVSSSYLTAISFGAMLGVYFLIDKMREDSLKNIIDIFIKQRFEK